MRKTGPFSDFTAAFKELHRQVAALCAENKLTLSTIGTVWIRREGEEKPERDLFFDQAKLVAHFLGIMRDGISVEPAPAVSEEQVTPFFSDSAPAHLQYAALKLRRAAAVVPTPSHVWAS